MNSLNDNIRLSKNLIIAYFLCLTVFDFFIFPSHDILFYYYPWSKHLQLSYYDGPPMIAYVIRLSTSIFGHNQFALNFWGVVVAMLCCYAIIRIGEILVNREIGYIASLMWLIYPFATTRFIFVTLNYDSLDCLFGLWTTWFSLRYLRSGKLSDLYLVGIFGGLLLLSKYTGLILLLSIVIYFIIDGRQRKVFANPHLYLAVLVCLAVFAPVLIWNYYHDWASFKYQLTTHSWSQGTYKAAHAGISGVAFYIFTDVLGVLHILIALLLFAFYKLNVNHELSAVSSKPEVRLLWVIFAVYFVFWLIMSYSSHIAMNYLIVPDSILIILTVYYLFQAKLWRLISSINIIFILISLVMLIDRAFIKPIDSWDIEKYNSLNLTPSVTLFHGIRQQK